MVEEKKSNDFFRALVPQGADQFKGRRKTKSEELVVTPELLLTQFTNNYMECSALQKRGVKRRNEVSEKKLERDLTSTRHEWNSCLNLLLKKELDLNEVLTETGCECPPILLGIPSQQLERLERLTFWARMILNNSKKPECDHENTIRKLLDELCELKQKVKKQETRIQKLSGDLVLTGNNPQSSSSVYPDVISYNSSVFHLQDVLSKGVYEPCLFDHNDMYFHFTTLDDAVRFHNNCFKKCIMDQCVPDYSGFRKCADYPKFTLEQLGHGCYIGLMVITNLCDTSDGNHQVNFDNMCLSCGEQLSSTFLQPGKKYVTWYLGQYSKDKALTDAVQWSSALDGLFTSVQQAPVCWNSEFVVNWKHFNQSKPYKPMYTCLLPGVKEVTRDTWGTTDTLDWVVRNVDFWSHQLKTYAPHGYNVKLNHHFHRSLFLETPQLMKFPVLWQFKRSLQDLVAHFRDKQHMVLHNDQLAFYCGNMKTEFQKGNFNLVFHQWGKVKELMQQQQHLLQECAQEAGKLRMMLDTIQITLKKKLCQAEALIKLDGSYLGDGIEKYSFQMQELMLLGEGLLQSQNLVSELDVNLSDMEALEEHIKELEFTDSQWIDEVCDEVVVKRDLFFEQFIIIKKRVKTTRNSHHPDRQLQCVDPDIQQYHKYQSWVVQLNAIEKVQDGFFYKVR